MAEQNKSVEATVRSIRRAMRKKYTAEEKVRIVLEVLRGESTITELCQKEGIQPNLYSTCSTGWVGVGVGGMGVTVGAIVGAVHAARMAIKNMTHIICGKGVRLTIPPFDLGIPQIIHLKIL